MCHGVPVAYFVNDIPVPLQTLLDDPRQAFVRVVAHWLGERLLLTLDRRLNKYASFDFPRASTSSFTSGL